MFAYVLKRIIKLFTMMKLHKNQSEVGHCFAFILNFHFRDQNTAVFDSQRNF